MTLFPQLQFAIPIAQWVKTKSTLLLKKSMGRWPFYTENVLVSVASSMSIFQPRETFPKRFSLRYSGSQHADWISENLNCTRLLLQLGSICSHWRSIIWSAPSLWTMYLLGRDPVPPLIVALMFSNAGDGCVSVEVNLNKISHESLLLIFQHHRVQIRALRIQLSCDDSTRRGWDRLASYFSQPTEWPNLRVVGAYTELKDVSWFNASDTWSWFLPLLQIISRGVCRCINLLSSVYVVTLLTNVSICSSTVLILSNFIVSFQQSILTPSFRPRPYSAHLTHRKFVRISEFSIGEASMRVGIDFCSLWFDFLTLRSSPGECLVIVYISLR